MCVKEKKIWILPFQFSNFAIQARAGHLKEANLTKEYKAARRINENQCQDLINKKNRS